MQITAYPYESKTPVGFPDRPYFVRMHITSQKATETVFELQDEDGVPGPVYAINGDGLRWAPGLADWGHEKFADPTYRASLEGLPVDGWGVASVRSDQTGGIWMVDVFVFDNGYCLTVTDEVACLWPSVEHWDNCGYDGYDEEGIAEIGLFADVEAIR